MRLLIIVLLISNSVFAQYWGGQEISESDLMPWVPKFEMEYQGTYHFGESEMESNLNLFFSGGFIIGQVENGSWVDDTNQWKSNYINLTNIKIDKTGKFSSDQHTGQFVHYKTENGALYKSLKIDNPWSSWIEDSKFEIGTKSELILKDSYYGKYIEASYKKLQPAELHAMHPDDLQIMRNEIYARYGYIFIKNGKMDLYFRNQDWYRPEHKNVNDFLSDLERYNIGLIRSIE
ncbi:YARHG domain-containing protein [Algibacter sp. TI.3.09]|uniref:YARHG domain-containing protein n=1 Tax=Algibacter sp. TI.3.09 TaxID=3121298 RepID=UPI00311D5B3D